MQLKFQNKPVNHTKIKKETEILCKDFELTDYKEYIDKIEKINKSLQIDCDEEKHEEDANQFNLVKSNGSCRISDIQGIVFGPMSSRFWLYRKHMITMDIRKFKDAKNLPFFAWECLTL